MRAFIKTLLGKSIAAPLCWLCFSNVALAAGGGAAVKMIDYYEMILKGLFGLEGHAVHDWMPTAGGIFSLLVLVIVGLLFKRAMEQEEAVTPPDRFSLRAVVEMLMDVVYNLGQDIVGKKYGPTYFPLLAALFLFILVSNLSGLVPGFLPATDNINTNLAMGFTVFILYNFAGIREHGLAYVKQFLGPVLFLMPLMLIIELVGHMARPVSLSLRLYGNIFGDHLVLSVFTGLTVLVFPALLLFFGLMVASLQSFVFTLLTSIYISMAVSHDH